MAIKLLNLKTVCMLIACCSIYIDSTEADLFDECLNVATEQFVANDANCQAYIYCDGNDSYMDECPHDTYFDAERQECAFDDDLQCFNQKQQQQQQPAPAAVADLDYTSTITNIVATATMSSATSASSMNIAPSSTAASAASAAASTLAPRPHCKRHIDEYFPHPQRCEYYYRCMGGYLTIVRCGRNAAWDYKLQKCAPQQNANCFKQI